MLSNLQEKLRRIFFARASLKHQTWKKEGYGYNKHETFDALMACYEKAASEYDEVNEIRQCYFQSAASLIKDEFAPTFIITNDVKFLAFSFIIARAQCI